MKVEQEASSKLYAVLRLHTMQFYANLFRATPTHLFGDNGGKINLMVSIVLEGLSHHSGNKDGGHGQQAVCPECLNY